MNDQISKDLQKIFKQFDVNNNGYIQLHQLTKVAEALGENLSEQSAKKIIQRLDVNKDGKIQMQEFKNWWIHGFKGKMGRLVYLQAHASKIAKSIVKILQNKVINSKKNNEDNQKSRINVDIGFGQQAKDGLGIKVEAYFKGKELNKKLQSLKSLIPTLKAQNLTIFMILPNQKDKNAKEEVDDFINTLNENENLPQEVPDIMDNDLFSLTVQECAEGTLIAIEIKESVMNMFQMQIATAEMLGEKFNPDNDSFMVNFQFKTNFTLEELLEKKNVIENLLKGFLLRLKIQFPKSVLDKMRQAFQQSILTAIPNATDIIFFLVKVLQFKIKIKSPQTVEKFFKKVGIEEILKQTPNLQQLIETFSEHPILQSMKNQTDNPLHFIYLFISFLKKYISSGIQIGICWRQMAFHLQLRYPGLYKVFNCLFNEV